MKFFKSQITNPFINLALEDWLFQQTKVVKQQSQNLVLNHQSVTAPSPISTPLNAMDKLSIKAPNHRHKLSIKAPNQRHLLFYRNAPCVVIGYFASHPLRHFGIVEEIKILGRKSILKCWKRKAWIWFEEIAVWPFY